MKNQRFVVFLDVDGIYQRILNSAYWKIAERKKIIWKRNRS